MYRSVAAHHIHPQRWQESWARLLAPLTLWICVSATLRYGYYGNCRMVLGPSSSRLVKASSVFVKQVEVRDDDKKQIFLYGFSEKPELSHETNWSVSDFLIVGSYNRKGFSLWLNKGSRIHIRLEAQTSSLNHLLVDIIKGEGKYETLLPNPTNSSNHHLLNDPTRGRAAEYTIEEDDRYYVGITNTNPRSIILTMNVNVSSKMYDTTKARSMCSTSNGSCRLKLLFPNTQYVIVTTPNNGDLGGWYVELSFVARVVTYVAILGAASLQELRLIFFLFPFSRFACNCSSGLTYWTFAGFVVIIIFLILKYLGACDGETIADAMTVREITETAPIMPEKPLRFTYGTGDEDEESGSSSSSSEDLYDGKICVICYDKQRNCFFVPCGHCATCYDCAQRIMEGENKVCPICRRLVHKLRKLFTP